jgi:hypothetical protein
MRLHRNHEPPSSAHKQSSSPISPSVGWRWAMARVGNAPINWIGSGSWWHFDEFWMRQNLFGAIHYPRWTGCEKVLI